MPAVNVSDYFNHKMFPCILLLQAMVDHKHHFMNAYAEWPGSVYDAQILANSVLILAMGEARTIIPIRYGQ